MWIDTLGVQGRSLCKSASYEPHIEDAFGKYAKPALTVLDVGANEDYFTLLAARLVGPRGRVVAVEPQLFPWPDFFNAGGEVRP